MTLTPEPRHLERRTGVSLLRGAIGAMTLAAALALIEPAILILMGVVVVFILISLYLPIFSLGQSTGM